MSCDAGSRLGCWRMPHPPFMMAHLPGGQRVGAIPSTASDIFTSGLILYELAEFHTTCNGRPCETLFGPAVPQTVRRSRFRVPSLDQLAGELGVTSGHCQPMRLHSMFIH